MDCGGEDEVLKHASFADFLAAGSEHALGSHFHPSNIENLGICAADSFTI